MMKKQSGNKVRLGILVTASIALFMGGIYFVGQRQQLFSSTFHIKAVFKDISGLQVGNSVRFSGINVGVVECIEQITDSSVSVVMVINSKTRKFIKKNARAIIGSDGLMGNKIVSVLPGITGEKEVVDNDVIATSAPASIDDILISLKITSDNAADITDNLAVVMSSIRNGRGAIGKLLMDSTLGTSIDRTMANLKSGTGGFKQNMDAAGHNFLLRGYFKKKSKENKK
jgi:phospholipid/cholesterol/gamma-HCH transport system substrate-binding protein